MPTCPDCGTIYTASGCPNPMCSRRRPLPPMSAPESLPNQVLDGNQP